jgi:hypothetical protein
MKNPAKAGDAGAINVYRCQDCGTETWTRDIDGGTTPFIILCRADGCLCRGLAPATSAMYPKFIPDDVVGTWEWWKPRTEADARIQAAIAVDAIIALKGRSSVSRDVGIDSTVEHWRQGGLYLRKSSEPWGPGVGTARPTLATPGVEPISRDGVEPGPGDRAIFQSIADLAQRGLVHFVSEGAVIPKGLAFKRWPVRGGGFNVTANLMADGFRMRVLSRPEQAPTFDLFIDDKSSGPMTVDGVIDALKLPQETRVEFLERALVRARGEAQAAAPAPDRQKLAHDDDGA